MRLRRLAGAVVLGLVAVATPLASSPAAAVEVEWNVAVASGPPPSFAPCKNGFPGAIVCFGGTGDKWYVKDTLADGHSAGGRWQNFLRADDNVAYRYGTCINKLGNGQWGVCNKDYYETSFLEWDACTIESSTRIYVACSLPPSSSVPASSVD